MPKSVVSELHSFRQRQTLSGNVIRLLESFRDSYFPGVTTWEAFMLLLILHRIGDMHELGRIASASALAWSTGLPRTTVQQARAAQKDGCHRAAWIALFVVGHVHERPPHFGRL